jgi:hypothetical protein
MGRGSCQNTQDLVFALYNDEVRGNDRALADFFNDKAFLKKLFQRFPNRGAADGIMAADLVLRQ